MSGIHRDDQGGDPLLKLLRGIGRVALLLLIALTPGLLPFSKGAAPVHAADWSQGVVIRADRIEIKGLLPLLAVGSDGKPVLRLIAGEAKVYGMTMAAANRAHGWGMEIADGGMVPIRGLQVDATALGFRIKGLPIQIGDSIPSIVLHEVFMKVDRLDAKEIDLHGLDMSTRPDVSLTPGAPVLDLRPLVKSSGEELEDEINRRLREMATEPSEDGEQEDAVEPDGEGEGRDSNGRSDPGDSGPGSDPKPNDPDQPEPEPDEGGEKSADSEVPVVENVKLGKTIGLVRARELVKAIKNYDATVTIKKGRKEAKADDYWAVVGLGLLRGTEVTLSAEGRQSRQAVDALARFLAGR